MPALKTLKKASKVDITMEKWQRSLIPDQPDNEELEQGVTSVTGVDSTTQAEEVAQRTEELLATRGWCLWQCEALGGEVVVVTIDGDVPGIPRGKVVYTEAELKKLFGGEKPVNGPTLRLIHEAKKQGAVITVPACWRGARCQK